MEGFIPFARCVQDGLGWEMVGSGFRLLGMAQQAQAASGVRGGGGWVWAGRGWAEVAPSATLVQTVPELSEWQKTWYTSRFVRVILAQGPC